MKKTAITAALLSMTVLTTACQNDSDKKVKEADTTETKTTESQAKKLPADKVPAAVKKDQKEIKSLQDKIKKIDYRLQTDHRSDLAAKGTVIEIKNNKEFKPTTDEFKGKNKLTSIVVIKGASDGKYYMFYMNDQQKDSMKKGDKVEFMTMPVTVSTQASGKGTSKSPIDMKRNIKLMDNDVEGYLNNIDKQTKDYKEKILSIQKDMYEHPVDFVKYSKYTADELKQMKDNIVSQIDILKDPVVRKAELVDVQEVRGKYQVPGYDYPVYMGKGYVLKIDGTYVKTGGDADIDKKYDKGDQFYVIFNEKSDKASADLMKKYIKDGKDNTVKTASSIPYMVQYHGDTKEAAIKMNDKKKKELEEGSLKPLNEIIKEKTGK